jgi:hypothetical protein
VEATLIDVKTNDKVWMALISAPAEEGREGAKFVLLAEAIAAKVLSADLFSPEGE